MLLEMRLLIVFMVAFTADYNLNKWFNASLIIGADYTSDARKQNFEKGSRTRSTGYVSLTQYNSFLTDAILNISGGDAITDKINLNYLVSANAFDRTRSFLNSNGSNFAFQGFVNLANASNVAGGENFIRTTQMGFVGQLEMDWDSTVYLTLAARQDYDSRLGVPNTPFKASDYSFVYPAASVSFLLSELLPQSETLSFAKVRASWAQVGGPPPFAYLTTSGYSN